MNFEQLLYAEVLAQYQSMQKAAESLHISKSGLSHAINQLENELGIKLFIKDSKGTFVTPEGRQLLASINEILRSKNKLINTAMQFTTPKKRNSLKIYYMNTMLKAFILPFIQNFKENYPQLTLDISCHEISSIIQSLKKEKIDIAFIATNNLEASLFTNLQFTPVMNSKLVLLCSKDNPLLNLHRPITIDELKEQTFCLFNDKFHEDIFNKLQFQCGPLQLVLRVDDSWAMQQAVNQLNAVCFCRINQSELSSDDHLSSLCTIDVGHIINDQFQLGWLVNPQHEIAADGQLLIDEITKLLQTNPINKTNPTTM